MNPRITMRTEGDDFVRFALFLAAMSLSLAACVTTKQARVRSALLDAGVPPTTADCMAEPLGRDLSVSQLQSLQRVAKLAKAKDGQIDSKRALEVLRRDLDPETVGVVVRAGLGCLVRG